MKIDWRLSWYAVLTWILAIAVAGVVILPWFYLVLPLTFLLTTVIYFKKTKKSLERGLFVALIWFLVVVVLDLVEIIWPTLFNFAVYFSDLRNWLKYPLILLIPVIYSMVWESRRRANF